MKYSRRIAIALLIVFITLEAGNLIRHALIPYLLSEQTKTKKKAALITLDYLHPSFDALDQSIQNHAILTTSQWSDYINYYNQVTQAMPDMAEAYLLEGYCAFNNQQTDAAWKLIQKAAQLNPYLFWNYYDLGILLLQNHHLTEAAPVLNAAIHIPPQITLKMMYSSKIYADLGIASQATLRLKQNYEACALLLNLIAQLTQNPDDVPAQKALNSLTATLKVF